MAGGIARDLQNLLTPIRLSAQLLRVGGREVASADMVATIESNVWRGGELIGHLLAFVRSMEGKRVPLDLRAVMEDARFELLEKFPRTILIEANVEGGLPAVLGHEASLRRALMNLCQNALESMPGGGVLRIKAGQAVLGGVKELPAGAAGGSYVRLSVEDTGSGISPENASKVFEPFFSTKSRDQGAGLGLPIASGIARSHGGWIALEKHDPGNTIFAMYLRVAEDSKAPPVGAVAPRVANAAGGPTLLFVDDNIDIRQIAKALLERRGYRLLTACDGAEGIAAFAGQRSEIKAVLTDVTMPVMDGIEMIRRIRAIDQSVPIIVMSGCVAEGQEAELAGEPNLTFLEKPFTPDGLYQCLARAVPLNPPPGGRV